MDSKERKEKKKRINRVCETCKQKRKGCDNGTPCLRCKKSNIECVRNIKEHGRRRVISACETCKQKRRGCDNGTPCLRCKKSNIECVRKPPTRRGPLPLGSRMELKHIMNI
jgi:Fungal Zn(2)-Cys(6) binuclear cluster domain